MGLSLRNCALKIIDTKTGKQVYSDFGEMLFTHFGASGPNYFICKRTYAKYGAMPL